MSSLLFPILSLGASVGLFFVFLRPTYGTVKAARVEVGQLKTTLESAREVQAERDRLVSKYNAIAPADLDRLEKMLPNYVDNVRLILEIDEIADSYGMTLNDLAISGESEKASKAKGEAGGAAAKPGVVTFSFRTASSYETFLQFLNDLEHSLRVVDVTTLSFVPGGTGEARKVAVNNLTNYYTFSVTLQTYWLASAKE